MAAGCEVTFLDDISEDSLLTAELEKLARELKWRACHRAFQGYKLTLKAKYADFTQVMRSITLESPITEESDMLEYGKYLLRQVDYNREHPIRLLGLPVNNPLLSESHIMGIVSEHLLEFAKSAGISKHKFETLCGMSNGLLSKISDRVRPEMVANIESAFPQLNMNWVFTGEGDMILEVPPTITEVNNNGTECSSPTPAAPTTVVTATDSDEVINLKMRIAVLEAELKREREFTETLKDMLLKR